MPYPILTRQALTGISDWGRRVATGQCNDRKAERGLPRG